MSQHLTFEKVKNNDAPDIKLTPDHILLNCRQSKPTSRLTVSGFSNALSRLELGTRLVFWHVFQEYSPFAVEAHRA